MNEIAHPSRIERDSALADRRKPIRCDVDNCGFPAVSSVELRFLCVDHFISHCYKRLEQFHGSPLRCLNSTHSEFDDRFLRECADQAASLACPLRGFDNLDRARLFDIFLWASELIVNRSGFQPGQSGVPHS